MHLWFLVTLSFFNISKVSTSSTASKSVIPPKKGNELPIKIEAALTQDVPQKIYLNSNSNSSGTLKDIADDDLSENADMIDIRDEFEIEDESLVLAHLEKDILNFEELKETIAVLKKHLVKHADVNVVDPSEIVAADEMIKDLNHYMIKPYEQELKSLKDQIVRLDHKYDDEAVAQISSIIENAERFLEYSLEKVEQIEMNEQEWEVAEESVKIQDMIDLDEQNHKIVVEALKPVVSKQTKMKLSEKHNLKILNPYPTRKPGGHILSLDKSISEAKSKLHKMRQEKLLKNAKKQQVNRPKKITIESPEKQKLSELAKVSVLKKVKEDLESEALNDLKGKRLFSDPVERYSNGVKDALEVARESSHELINDKLRQEARIEQEHHYIFLPLFLAFFVLIIMVIVIGTYRMSRTPGISSRVSMQNFPGLGVAQGSERSYMELESVNEDGWGSWAPWSGNKKFRNKFK